MATAAELLVKIGADPSQFNKMIARTQKSLNRISAQISDIGDKMTTGLSAPIAAAGIAIGVLTSNMDSATGRIQAQLGTTGEETEKLGEIAEDVWKNSFGENMGEVADALTTVQRNMKGVADTDLQGLTESAFVLQQTFGTDIAESTRTAGTLMKNFSISGQKAFDIMTVGFQKGGDFSGELLDTLNEYAPQFASMGMSAEEMLNILIQGAQNGAFNLDKVGDAVKEFNVRAVDGSKTTAAGFEAIGLKAEQMGEAIAAGGPKAKQAFNATIAGLAAMRDPLAQQQAGVNLFGTQWEDVKKNVILAMDTSTSKLGEIDGATKQAGAAINDNFLSKIQGIWRETQSNLQPLGDILLTLADEWLPKVGAAVSSVAEWFSNLNPGMQHAVAVTGLLVAAIGPLLIGISKMVSAISSTIIPLSKSAIQATATAYKWAFLGTESKRSAVKVVAAWTSTAAAALRNAAVMVAQSAVMVTKWVWMGTQSLIQAARIAAAWLIAMGPIGIITAAVIGIVALIIANWDTIKAATLKVWNAIATFFSELWPKITDALTKAWEFIKQFFIKYWPVILGIFTGGIGLVVALLITKWDVIKETITKVWDSIRSFLSKTWGNIKTSASIVFNAIASALSGVWDSITGKVKSVWDGITSTIKGAINSVIKLVNSFISKFNSIHISIPSIKIPSVTIAGKTFGGGTIGGQTYRVPQIPSIPQLATGTNDVPQDMLAMIHKGEAVVPKKYNNGQNGTATIIVELDGHTIARAVGKPLTDLIRVKTGLRI